MCLQCDVHPQKGRILLAEKSFACGEKTLGCNQIERQRLHTYYILTLHFYVSFHSSSSLRQSTLFLRLLAEAPLHLVAEAPKDAPKPAVQMSSRIQPSSDSSDSQSYTVSLMHRCGTGRLCLLYQVKFFSLRGFKSVPKGDDFLGCTATFPRATSEQQRRLLMLFHPEPAAPSEERKKEC